MDSVTRGFWGLVVLLLGASVFFGAGAEAQRGAMSSARAVLEEGDSVTLHQVVDGHTVLVKNKLGEPLSIRLLGIKAFPLSKESPEVFRAGSEAVSQLGEMLRDRPLVVSLNSPPRDTHGRFLAYLSAEGKDVGLELIKSGAALAYTLYPFDRLEAYLEAQELARADKMGLWRTETLVRRADALLLAWRMQQ